MAAVDVVRARIETGLKREATAVLSAMGLSVSDAIRLMLVRVVSDKALPFDVRVPNAETQAAMRDIQEGKVKRFDSVDALMADLNDDETD
ncbi:type II toxin-antitoxin system RelB/DinJ family antitoxin [Sphingorhabdus sp.]|jgi:DNA-damage-inducible protein J|uniref:type II toxin-antitoxin system RelB/DinJ family antitoxin n=1 Tax=Sphingorhabdus sp. TaxID=1902408 RepID=UPI0037C6EB54